MNVLNPVKRGRLKIGPKVINDCLVTSSKLTKFPHKELNAFGSHLGSLLD